MFTTPSVGKGRLGMKTKKLWIVLLVLTLTGGVAFWFYGKHANVPGSGAGREANGFGGAVTVSSATARRGDMDVVINAMGTVTARNTATVKARVDGQLVSIAFSEGQMVKAGDLLAEIDPRPYQVLLDQVTGQLVRDQALLSNARLDLQRYQGLLVKDSIARQQVDAQSSLVQQDEGVVLIDRAQVDNARLQLGFTRISAPLSGRLGLRQLDVGNMIHASDANGLVVITQTRPIMVIFSIPSDQLSQVTSRLYAGDSLTVEAFDRDAKQKLATGKLLTVDNQIDVTTGTVKLKAQFPNADNSLFPNQFVNARLRVETKKDVTLVPEAAILRGTQGTFCYVIGQDQTVSIRHVVLGASLDDRVEIQSGLKPGEQVVIDGADRLRADARVVLSEGSGGKGEKPGVRNNATPVKQGKP